MELGETLRDNNWEWRGAITWLGGTEKWRNSGCTDAMSLQLVGQRLVTVIQLIFVADDTSVYAQKAQSFYNEQHY